jgi:alpha-1,6-mannosyltransferase
LESVLGATPREFESRILRQLRTVARRPEVAIPDSDRLRRAGVLAALLLAAAAGCLAVTQLLGPSATESPLGRYDSGATPPWHLAAGPPAWLVVLLPALAVVAGAGAVALALTGRWRPSANRLTLAGILVVAALAMLPPIGSADTLSYAAYGRMAATGHDPYTTTPAGLARDGDPVAAAVEVPWRHTASVYGPVATAEQAAASAIAGRDVALTVWLLGLVNAAAFAGIALIAARMARDDAARRRAAVLWSANPLLWLAVGSGAHLDVLAALPAVAAIALLGRSRLGAGAMAGLAMSVKAPAGLILLALMWVRRVSRRDLALLVAGAAVVAIPGYAIAGRGAFEQLSRASRLVSLATPWRLLVDVAGPPRRLVGVLAFVLFVLLVAALARVGPPPRTAAAVAGVLTVAYVLAAPYALPWYDVLPWAVLSLAAASWRDWLLLGHTTVLSLSYLPGRAAAVIHGALHAVTWHMRTGVAPWLLLALLLFVGVETWRRQSDVTWRRHGDAAG